MSLTVNAGLPWIRITPLSVGRLVLLVVSSTIVVLLIFGTRIYSPSALEPAPLQIERILEHLDRLPRTRPTKEATWYLRGHALAGQRTRVVDLATDRCCQHLELSVSTRALGRASRTLGISVYRAKASRAVADLRRSEYSVTECRFLPYLPSYDPGKSRRIFGDASWLKPTDFSVTIFPKHPAAALSVMARDLERAPSGANHSILDPHCSTAALLLPGTASDSHPFELAAWPRGLPVPSTDPSNSNLIGAPRSCAVKMARVCFNGVLVRSTSHPLALSLSGARTLHVYPHQCILSHETVQRIMLSDLSRPSGGEERERERERERKSARARHKATSCFFPSSATYRAITIAVQAFDAVSSTDLSFFFSFSFFSLFFSLPNGLDRSACRTRLRLPASSRESSSYSFPRLRRLRYRVYACTTCTRFLNYSQITFFWP